VENLEQIEKKATEAFKTLCEIAQKLYLEYGIPCKSAIEIEKQSDLAFENILHAIGLLNEKED
jgi:hypothetical protein